MIPSDGLFRLTLWRPTVFRRVLLALVAICILTATPAGAGTVTFSDVFLFGTSELDTGNWLLDPVLAADPLAPTAAKGYWNGRWQEGPSWSDYFAEALGHDATPSLAGGQNYAYGLGWLGPLAGESVSGYSALTQLYFGSQVTAALTDYGGALPGDALYVISVGSNDPAFYGRTALSQATARANIEVSQIQRLANAGADYFLVQTLGGTDPWVNTYNQTLLAGLAGISGINVGILNTRTFNQTVVLAPGFLSGLGITDFGQCVNDPACLAASALSAGQGDPYLGNTHFMFDGVHRSTKVDEALADYALTQVPVPEPMTMTLVALGLGAAVLRVRRRR
jgi:outer membrane lipase/esterase